MELKNYKDGENLVFEFKINEDYINSLIEVGKIYHGENNKCILTNNEEIFYKIKECINEIQFDKNEYINRIIKYYSYLIKLKEYGILDDNINIDIDEFGFPNCNLDEYCPFIANSIILVKDNKEIDCLYYYPFIDTYMVDFAINMVKDKYRNQILAPICLCSLSSKQLRGDFIINVLKDLKPKVLKEDYTYIMSDSSGMYKIGKSFDPKCRLDNLGIGNPTIKLDFIIKGNIENKLHKLFKNKRVKGEWFRLDKLDLEIIKNYKKNRVY